MNLYRVAANWSKDGTTNYVRGGKKLEGSFGQGYHIGAIVAADDEESAIEQTRPNSVPHFDGQDKDRKMLKSWHVKLHPERTTVELIGSAADGITTGVLCTFDPSRPLIELDHE